MKNDTMIIEPDLLSYLENEFENDCKMLSELDIPQYDVSAAFKKKMERLIKRQAKPYFQLVCTAGRRAACIIAALIILSASSLGVKAVRQAVYKSIHSFNTKSFSDHVKIRINKEAKKNSPKTIETEYVISDIPEGFELTDYDKTDTYVLSWYFNGDSYILFHQDVKISYKSNYDNEQSVMYTYTDTDGQEYIIHETKVNSDFAFIWDNGEYIFTIDSNLDKNEILNLCRSIKPK